MAQILVVDDEVGIRELLSEILADEGHQVVLAESAGEARRLRERGAPRPGAARHLDAGHRRHHAAEGMGGQRPAHHAGGHDVRPRHHRDGGGGDAHRRARLPGEADRAAAPAHHRQARAAPPGGGARRRELVAGRARPLRGAGRRQEAAGPARAVRRAAAAARRARHAPGAVRAPARGAGRAVPLRRRACWASRPPSCWPRRPAASCSLPTCRASGRTEQRNLEFLLARAEKHKVRVVSFSPLDARTLAEKHEFDPELGARLGELTFRLPALREFAEDMPDLAVADAGAAGRGARLPAAAPGDRRAQRAAPPRLAGKPRRAGKRGQGPGAERARGGNPAGGRRALARRARVARARCPKSRSTGPTARRARRSSGSTSSSCWRASTAACRASPSARGSSARTCTAS